MPLTTCCGAYTNETDICICPDCKEHCDFEEIDVTDVYFEGDILVGDDSFAHEFGIQTYPKYYYMEEITWDESTYTAEENEAIAEYVKNNFDLISKQIIARNRD